MNITLEELKEKLTRLDEIALLELFEVSSEELVRVYTDYIEDNFEKLKKEVE